MIIKELLVSLGFEIEEGSDKEAEKFDQQISKATANLAKLTAVAVGTAVAVSAMVKSFAEADDLLGKNARQADLSAQELRGWNHVAEIVTGSSDGMADSLLALNRAQSEASRGQGAGIEAFGLLGVNIMNANGELKDTSTLMEEVLDATSKLGKGQQNEILGKLGLGNFSLLAQESVENMRKLRLEAEELAPISEEDIKNAEELNDSYSRMMLGLRGIATTISSTIAPVLSELIKQATKWLQVQKKLRGEEIKKTLKTIAKLVAFIFKILGSLVKVAMSLVDVVGGLNSALKIMVSLFGILVAYNLGALFMGLSKAVGFLAVRMGMLGTATLLAQAKMLAMPLLVGAGLVLLGLLLEDLWKQFEEGDSAIASIVKEIWVFQKATELLAEALEKVFTAWEKLKKMSGVDGGAIPTLAGGAGMLSTIGAKAGANFVNGESAPAMTKEEFDRTKGESAPAMTKEEFDRTTGADFFGSFFSGLGSIGSLALGNANKVNDSSHTITKEVKLEVTVNGDTQTNPSAFAEIKEAITEVSRQALKDNGTPLKQ